MCVCFKCTQTQRQAYIYLVLIWQMLTTTTTGDEDVSKDEHKAENGDWARLRRLMSRCLLSLASVAAAVSVAVADVVTVIWVKCSLCVFK